MASTVTVTAESDGTFYVRCDGNPYMRLPTQEAAERRAAHIRRYDAAAEAAFADAVRAEAKAARKVLRGAA